MLVENYFVTTSPNQSDLRRSVKLQESNNLGKNSFFYDKYVGVGVIEKFPKLFTNHIK